MRRLLPIAAVGLIAWSATCGGRAVIDGEPGEGGSGGDGGSGTSSASVTVSVAPGPGPVTVVSSVSSVSSGATAECYQACGELYACGQQRDPNTGLAFCPAFDGSSAQESVFVANCIQNLCNDIGFVQPRDCPSTIAYFKSVSPVFVYACDPG
jgi:hypothetical protein